MLFYGRSKYEYLIVGLGNPGDKYTETRHNAGFRCIDRLAALLGADISKTKFHSLIADAASDSHRLLLCKPLTFMNNSGEAVSEIVKFYKIPCENIIVISDDVSMDAGRLRIRKSGSHGGHNGLKDIIELCGTDNFPRVKIGVGQKPHPDYDLADWVLGKPSAADAAKITETEKNAAEAVRSIVTDGIVNAMNKFNR